MSLLGNTLLNETTKTLTENGCLTFTTSLNANVDLFFRGGALRGNNDKLLELFIKAYIEDKNLAIANLFYLRDCRNGIGERDLSRSVLKYLATNYSDVITNEFLNKIVQYGRYDDLLSLISKDNKKVNEIVISFIKSELDKNNTLLAKWLPSENASSNKTKLYASIIRTGLGLNSKSYRQLLSKMRKEQHLIETSMTNKDYNNVKYENLPSQAHFKHIKAFKRNDENRYNSYLNSLKNGKTKINTDTLNPVQIVEKYIIDAYSNFRIPNDDVYNQMWNNLPDMYDGREENSLVVCDVSGSMESSFNCKTRPLDVALSLALYIAERNKGIFNNEMITFSSNPSYHKIIGDDLYEKLCSMVKANWGGNTDLKKVFELVLKSCIDNKIPASECPKRIYIISDMEFDDCTGDNSQTMFDYIKTLYKEAGYEIPQLFFWNVDSKSDNVPVRYNDKGVALISGYSPKILKYIIGKEEITPEAIMMDTLKKYM